MHSETQIASGARQAWARRAAFIACVALAAASPAALADGRDDGCGSSLRGLYLFNASGFNLVNGAQIPKTIVEYIEFSEDGTLYVPNATLDILGLAPIRTQGGTGTYTLSSNCTGSITFTPGPTLDMYVGADGDLALTQTGGMPAGVLQGTAERLHR